MRVADGVRTPTALPQPVRAPLAVVSVLAAIAVVVLGVLFADQTSGTTVDASLRAQLLDVQDPWYRVAAIIDYAAEPIGSVLVLAALVLTFWRMGQPRIAVLVVVGTGVSVTATTALKPLVGRTINDSFSFPSGHTATATAYAFALAMVIVSGHGATRAMLWIAALTVPAAAAMAWAEVAMNAHYPTDTVGGFATALAVLPPTAWAIDRIANRLTSTRTP